MNEDFTQAGGAWGPNKAWAFDRLVFQQGLTIAQIARSTRISPHFLSSLRGFDVRYSQGSVHYATREPSRVLKVLAALGTTEKEFLRKAQTRP